MNVVRRIHLVVAWAFVAGVVFQVFLAGLGVFAGPDNFKTHMGFGFLLGLVPLVMLVLAAIGGLGPRQLKLDAALFGLFIIQSILVGFRGSAPTIAALHPVNGFLLLLVAVVAAREAWRTRADAPSRAAAPAEPAPAAEGSAGS